MPLPATTVLGSTVALGEARVQGQDIRDDLTQKNAGFTKKNEGFTNRNDTSYQFLVYTIVVYCQCMMEWCEWRCTGTIKTETKEKGSYPKRVEKTNSNHKAWWKDMNSYLGIAMADNLYQQFHEMMDRIRPRFVAYPIDW